MSRLRLIAAMAIALVLLLPATVLAATFEVSGTVTDKGGAPVAGAEITILVQGTDTILSTTSDASGAWSLEVDADAGAVLEVNGTGPESRSDPDSKGCITTTTGSGQALATLPQEGALDPVALALDNEITGTVCSATATPERENITPPSTDTIGDGRATGVSGSVLLLGLLAAFSGVTLLATAAVRPGRRR